MRVWGTRVRGTEYGILPAEAQALPAIPYSLFPIPYSLQLEGAR
jgi:hypothetical protein